MRNGACRQQPCGRISSVRGKDACMATGFARSLRAATVSLALLALDVGIVHAGAGWGDSTDITGAPIKVPTYYASSPSGPRPDPLGGAVVDTGLPLRKFVDGLPGVP